MKIKLLLFVFFVALPFVSFAKKVTLDQCLDLGYHRNLSLERTDLETQLNSPSKLQAWSEFLLPSISMNYSILDRSDSRYETYESVDPRNPGVIIEYRQPVESTRFNSGYTITANQTFFAGGRDFLNLRNSYLRSKVRDLQVTAEEFNIRTQVTQAFCQAVGAQRGLDVAKRLVEQRQLQYESAELRFQTGTVTRRDVLQTDVDLGRARNDSLNAAMAVRQTREALNLLLDFPLDTTFVLNNLPPLFRPVWNADSLVDIAMVSTPNLESTRLLLKINRNNNLSAWGSYFPEMALSISHNRSEQSSLNNPFKLVPQNSSTSIGVRSSWSLFSQFSRAYATQETKIRKRQSQLDIITQEKELKRLVKDTIDRLNVLYQQSSVAKKNGQLAEETLSFENERYRLGSGTVIDLSAAQVSYIEALREEIALETEFHITLSQLEQGTGQILRGASGKK